VSSVKLASKTARPIKQGLIGLIAQDDAAAVKSEAICILMGDGSPCRGRPHSSMNILLYLNGLTSIRQPAANTNGNASINGPMIWFTSTHDLSTERGFAAQNLPLFERRSQLRRPAVPRRRDGERSGDAGGSRRLAGARRIPIVASASAIQKLTGYQITGWFRDRGEPAMQEPGTHNLTEAIKGPQADAEQPSEQAGRAKPPGPGSTPAEIAEQTRREQEVKSHEPPDRDDYLTQVGRGQQTHG
jgi:hypothetical protein